MKYKVLAKETTYSYLEIEANSPEEAKNIAEDIDGGMFTSLDDGEWEIIEAEEVK